MTLPRVYADFQNLDDSNRLRLNCTGTIEDLTRQKIRLREGMTLSLYMDDADDQGRPDEIRVNGTVQHDPIGKCWVAAVDWLEVRHASDDVPPNGNGANVPKADSQELQI